jgi:hypothetical protein
LEKIMGYKELALDILAQAARDRDTRNGEDAGFDIDTEILDEVREHFPRPNLNSMAVAEWVGDYLEIMVRWATENKEFEQERSRRKRIQLDKKKQLL